MLSSINFKGSFEQPVYKNLQTKKGVIIPLPDPNTGYLHSKKKYNAFERDDLIPSLVKLVKKVNKKGDRDKECKKWIAENGFLTLHRNRLPRNGQPLNEFWEEAVILVDYWLLYRSAVNRNISDLKKLLDITIEPLSDDEIKNEEFLWGKGNDARVNIKSNLDGLRDSGFGIVKKEILEDPLAPYQFAIIHYIAAKVTYYIGDVLFRYDHLSKKTYSDKDSFTIQVSIEPATLLQAMYLRFLQILTENRKVCDSCFNSFLPGRTNQRFCNDSCRSTYHSRKRRPDKPIKIVTKQ